MIAKWRKSYKRLKNVNQPQVQKDVDLLRHASLERRELVGEEMADKPLSDTDLLIRGFVSCSDSGLRTLSSITGIPPERMAGILRDSVLQSSKSLPELIRDAVFPPSASPAKPLHWTDVLVCFIAFLLLLGLIAPVIEVPFQSKKQMPPASPQVIAVTDIPAFSTIRPQDLTVKHGSSEAEGNQLMSKFIGHYASSVIWKGDPVSLETVSKEAVNLDGLQIFQMGIKTVPPLAGRTLPQIVDVLLSPRQQGGQGARMSGLLLTVSSSPDTTTATLAIPPADIRKGIKWFASCDAYLSFPVSGLGASGINSRQGLER